MKLLSFYFIIRAPRAENLSTRFYPPITFDNNTHFISMYADDILSFSDKAVTSKPHIFDVFEFLLAILANKNFPNIYNKIEADLDRWPYLPKSLEACVSIIKLWTFFHILISSQCYPYRSHLITGKKNHSLMSKFIWGGKQLHVGLGPIMSFLLSK